MKPAHGARVKKKDQEMKTTSVTLLMALALSLPAVNLLAQEDDQPRPPRGPRVQHREDGDFAGPRDGGPRERGPRDGEMRERGPRFDGERQRGPRPDGPGPETPRPPLPPLMGVLDGNHDGVIDEAEINNASTALKALDKNHDGKVTREELRPPRPLPPQGGEFGARQQAPRRQPRGPAFQGDAGRPDGPPSGEAPRAPRRAPRPPQDQE